MILSGVHLSFLESSWYNDNYETIHLIFSVMHPPFLESSWHNNKLCMCWEKCDPILHVCYRTYKMYYFLNFFFFWDFDWKSILTGDESLSWGFLWKSICMPNPLKINCALPSLNIVSILSLLSLSYKIYQCTWEYTNYLLPLINEQSLAIKLIVTKGYNHTNFFIWGAFGLHLLLYLPCLQNLKKIKD